jgi:hypothetical protein
MAIRWSDEECEVLRLAVCSWVTEEPDSKIDWKFVSDELHSVGFDRTSKACKNKYSKLKNSEFAQVDDVPENTPLESSEGPLESSTESDESSTESDGSPTESDESPTESDECCSNAVTNSTSTSYSYSFSNSGGIVSSSASSSSSGGSSSSSSSSSCCLKHDDHVEVITESASSNKLFSILKKVKKIIKFK